MKKFLTAILTALTLCLSLFCLFGCSKNIEGKYMLAGAVGQEGTGPWTHSDKQDENGVYVNVVGGFMVPEEFWVEIKGKTMTIHGSISVVGANDIVMFNVNEGSVRSFTFTLKTSEDNKHWYDVFDEKGDNTRWSVAKDGKSMIFQFGKTDDNFWYNFTYNKA